MLRPHGVGGKVAAEVLSDFPERFAAMVGEQVLLEGKGYHRTATVAEASASGRRAVLKFEGYDSPGEVEVLRGAYVKIAPSQAASLPKGEYFWHDIVGLRVVDKTGRELGQVTDVLRMPAHDVYVTDKVMIPAVKEIVKEIDVAAGRMVVDLPPQGP